jgi:hypothetical protein
VVLHTRPTGSKCLAGGRAFACERLLYHAQLIPGRLNRIADRQPERWTMDDGEDDT